MRIRTALAALALTAAGIIGTAASATAHDFGDISIVTDETTNVLTGCNAGFIADSPSAQCGIFHIATP
ncbi:hypothetical protein ACIBCM_06215 [Streptomyces sp. NPDC051018]|uniref:hypothetical protein n=1 Tax=Streptomyces sp. NPDC051018 TaxID=3365639 RepID=UPI0037A25A43